MKQMSCSLNEQGIVDCNRLEVQMIPNGFQSL